MVRIRVRVVIRVRVMMGVWVRVWERVWIRVMTRVSLLVPPSAAAALSVPRVGHVGLALAGVLHGAEGHAHALQIGRAHV